MAVQKFKLNENSKIENIVAVISGKGGVGKSFVCGSLASELTRRGKKVGILDADITGPSIPKMFGIENSVRSDGGNILPEKTHSGIKVMSVNLILPDPSEPVLWRSPIISNAIAQFYENVNWGDLDYLLIDMPPGTGDVALTVFQSIDLDGAVIVSSPQDLVNLIVEKAVNMSRKMNVDILALVENMSYLKCPHCGEKTEIFGPSKLEDEAKKYDIERTARLPIDPKFSSLIDQGRADEIEIVEIKNLINELIPYLEA